MTKSGLYLQTKVNIKIRKPKKKLKPRKKQNTQLKRKRSSFYCITYDAASQSLDWDIDETSIDTVDYDSKTNHPSKLRIQITKQPSQKNENIDKNFNEDSNVSDNNKAIKVINLDNDWHAIQENNVIFETFDLLSDDFIVGFYFRTETDMHVEFNVTQP